MALIECQKCGATIGSRLSACPYCKPDKPAPVAPLAIPKAIETVRIPGSFNFGMVLAGLFFSLLALMFALFQTKRPPASDSNAAKDAPVESPADVAAVSQGPKPSRTTSAVAAEKEVAPVNPMVQLIADAHNGDPDAQFELGFSVYPDSDRVKDYREALRWFREAAEAGHVESQKQVGWMHYEGHGVLRDSEEALKWYGMAAAQGDEEALRAVEALTEDQDEKARQAAARIQLAAIGSIELNAASGAGRTPVQAGRTIEGERWPVAPVSNESYREEPDDQESPLIVVNESNQYIVINHEPEIRDRVLEYEAINQRPDPRDRYHDYLAASGFFARARQDAASRDFFERNRNRDKGRTSASRRNRGLARAQTGFNQSGFVTSRSRGFVPLPGGPRPLTKGVTPMTRGVTPLGRLHKAPWEESPGR